MTPTLPFTPADLQEQLREVGRVVTLLGELYPHLIARGKLQPAKAAYQIRVLEGVAVTVRHVLAQAEAQAQETLATNPFLALDDVSTCEED